MTRVVKQPDIRKSEIADAARMLFHQKGYQATTVEEITQATGIAKGTFYHYFKNKEDILDWLVKQMAMQIAIQARNIADMPNKNPVEKIMIILSGGCHVGDSNQYLLDQLHQPENRELHEKSNIKAVITLSPIIAEIIEQGKKEHFFDVEDSLSTIQFILAGSSFLLDKGLFNWEDNQENKIKIAMIKLIERALGAKPGTLMPN